MVRYSVMHAYNILHVGDLNENDNCIEDKLVMHHEMHGYKKNYMGVILTNMTMLKEGNYLCNLLGSKD